ncbi:MAG: collagen-like protein [Spirosoma sp.]|uniref:collagen-like protein n=2 Tax=Spirosoma TaxID=107 RepID=UPI001ACF3BC9|nr:collagen-like protein [Spirosoma sp.]MBN8823765.1 collagen-like protein [Spirosoma sp.]
MKTMQILSMTLLMAVCILQTACKGPQGEVGPAGPTGASGAAGPAGNANVLQINYAGRAVTGSFTLNLPGVNADRANNSLVFCYIFGTNSNWYQLPGFTNGGAYEYRTYLIPAATSILGISRVTNSTGTDTFVSIRVLVIQASSVVNGRKAAVDYSDYNAVKAYYNLPD